MGEEKIEEKNETQKQEESKKMASSTLLKYALGGVLVLLGILAIFVWWSSVWSLIKGSIGFILVLAGAIVIAIAKE